MIALLVEDEPILLDFLCKMVLMSPDIEYAEKFTNEADALLYAENHPFDIAFLDIELRENDGLTVAESLRSIHPDCGIVFCTGHPDYAVDAISRLHVDGYLIKPIEKEQVQREIDRFKERYNKNETLLTVDLSAGINIFDRNGSLIRFKRSKTEKLFAFLVKHKGQSVSTRELCEYLWADSTKSQYLYEKNENYLGQLFSDLRRTLSGCGAQDVLKKNDDGYAVCMSFIKYSGD